MPPYFNLSVQFRRKDLYPSFMRDFYTMLGEAGMAFRSGYWGFEADSLEDIIVWNQKKLEDDYKLGFTEHHSHDYKQVIYKVAGYSEVRGFWMNRYPEKGTFTHEIIIPESDVLEKGYPARFKEEKIGELLGYSGRIWQFPPVKTIQTGLEGNDASTGLTKLAEGECPNVCPFAIVEETQALCETLNCKIQPMIGERKGLLFLWKEE